MDDDPARDDLVGNDPARDGRAAITCPWCGSSRVERVAAFGAQLMSEQYMCLECKSPFEHIRK